MAKYKKEFVRLISYLSTMGIELAANVLVGFGIGWILDKFFNTHKTFTIIFILLGVVAGVKTLYTVAKRVEKELQEHKLDNVFEDENGKKRK